MVHLKFCTGNMALFLSQVDAMSNLSDKNQNPLKVAMDFDICRARSTLEGFPALPGIDLGMNGMF